MAVATIREADIDPDRVKSILECMEKGIILGYTTYKDGRFTNTYLFEENGKAIWDVFSIEEYAKINKP